MRSVLVTGGAGYIGSHTVLQLLEAGWHVHVLDNFANSDAEALRRVQQLVPDGHLSWTAGDMADTALVTQLLGDTRPQAVLHFAGLKAVGESVAEPLRYYRVNVGGTLSVLEAMQTTGVRQLVFSSSATVYGIPEQLPLTEQAALGVTNPYGATKLHIEQMLRDLHRAEPDFRIALLRYFNPVGAHPSGRIGEAPQGTPNNLMPYIAQVAAGLRPALTVYGDDYPTPDGTGVRDYIHVMDLAAGHLAALQALQNGDGELIVNLGTGRGYSVLEMAKAFEVASGRPVPLTISARRAGDVAACYADPSFARQALGWEAQRSLTDMCRDHWHWQHSNPHGYRSE
ncbi:UDP-glucose 4-epimerase GalE [Isoalcanivorax beigongshangi]|uniref:UDP-glucose 4-epimerase n=1 Tax=Isoalcanivorax beigongshangi TaxID=3238810 RepID=A0ABV4AIM0_9GAMM